MLDGFSAGCSYYMVKDDYDPDILEVMVKRLLSGEHTSGELSLMQTKFKIYKEEQEKRKREKIELSNEEMDNVAGGTVVFSQSNESADHIK